MTDTELRSHLEAFARYLARITLEIERGQRAPDQLRTYMPDQSWRHWQHNRTAGKLPGGPVHRTDIGRPRVELLTDHKAIANVVTATEPDRWGALTMQLGAHTGRWQAASIQRLYAARHYQTGPHTPAITRAPQQRLATARTDHEQATAALAAIERRRTELPRGSTGRRHATQLSTTWKQIIADLDREIATLLRHQHTSWGTAHERSRVRRI